ncbi:Plant UBX domain-containing protein 10 [Linum perenne]
MVDVADKLAYFQSITGLEDLDLCRDILQAHGWDLELAISSFTGGSNSASSTPSADTGTSLAGPSNSASPPSFQRSDSAIVPAAGPGLAWKLVTLPVAVISGSLGLVSGAVGLGLWVAGGILSYSFGMIGLGSSRGDRNGESSSRLVSTSPSASEAMDFVAAFEREYGTRRPNFVTVGFMEALQQSRDAYKLLFVYLHSPDHSDSPVFCEETLCSEVLTEFVNHNFVSWGGSIRASEGFKMSSSLKASRYPFCAVVMPATNQRIALLQQIEGPQSPEEMLTLLQRVLEESAPARERQRREEQERLEQEAAEAERKRKEEEEARERAAEEAAEREAARVRMRQEKASSLGVEPEKGADVTQVLVRFPAGERKERRFHSSTTIQSLYDFVDSLGYIEVEDYSLVSNFPRTVYGNEKRSLSLKEAGLHPQASLFVELN